MDCKNKKNTNKKEAELEPDVNEIPMIDTNKNDHKYKPEVIDLAFFDKEDSIIDFIIEKEKI